VGREKKVSAEQEGKSTDIIWHVVRQSPIHGRGVFAKRRIPAGTRIIEYQGQRITNDEADERHPANPDDPFHTFFFVLSSGKVIDGNDNGNDARWINHSCDPNCESEEGKGGKRVYIVAKRDIARGEELNYDYGLVMEEKITKKLRAQYGCRCGAATCRATMLAIPKKGTVNGKSKGKSKVKVQAESQTEV